MLPENTMSRRPQAPLSGPISCGMLRHMRTSIEIPDALLRSTKALARRKGVTLRELVIAGLRGVLAEERTGAAKYRLPDRSVGEGGLVDGLVATDWDTIRGRIYEGRGE